MPEDKRPLTIALIKLLDVYSRYNPNENDFYGLANLVIEFEIRLDELNRVESFVRVIRSFLEKKYEQ